MNTQFAIYINKSQEEKLRELLEEIGTTAKSQSQGSCTIHEDFYDRIREIVPKVTVVSCNYYDCDGKLAFAIMLTNKYNNPIKMNGSVKKGFAFGAPRGHLEKYFKLRW